MTLCCDPSMSLWDQIWSDTCQYCSADTLAAQQTAQQTQGLQPGQTPACDPNAGIFEQLFSNTCNATVNTAIGLPANLIPNWVWLAGIGLAGVVVLKVAK